MITITRKIEFDAGHRVYKHESKCSHLHGHRYVAEITVQAPELDSIGRVIDFSVIKTEVGGWVDDFWDHNMLLNTDDPFTKIICENIENNKNKYPYLFANRNPTAENIAEELFNKAQSLLSQYEIEVTHIRIYETPNCWADYKG